jgi:hypothetical protein
LASTSRVLCEAAGYAAYHYLQYSQLPFLPPR